MGFQVFPFRLMECAHMPRRWMCVLVLILFALLGIGFATYHLLIPPQGFPAGHLISIPEDATVGRMGEILEESGAIRSTFVFKAYARATFQDRALASGSYVFPEPISLFKLVSRMANGEHGIAPARVTLTEGMTVKDMSEKILTSMPDFDAESFRILASTSEGYLFPDTYFFVPGTTPEEVIERLRQRFDERIETMREAIDSSGRTLEDIVIVASLLEREAKTETEMRTVAGILWKRLDLDMPLQVDAVFGYIRKENGYTPTKEDLKLESPYNTYLYPGLPPGPIANPGLMALQAAASPLESPYLYYLTGRDGITYYGRTFEEHKRNRKLYLD